MVFWYLCVMERSFFPICYNYTLSTFSTVTERFLYPNTGSHKGKKAQFKEHKVFNSYFTLNLILLGD